MFFFFHSIALLGLNLCIFPPSKVVWFALFSHVSLLCDYTSCESYLVPQSVQSESSLWNFLIKMSTFIEKMSLNVALEASSWKRFLWLPLLIFILFVYYLFKIVDSFIYDLLDYFTRKSTLKLWVQCLQQMMLPVPRISFCFSNKKKKCQGNNETLRWSRSVFRLGLNGAVSS